MLTSKVKILFFLSNGTEHNDYLSLIFAKLAGGTPESLGYA